MTLLLLQSGPGVATAAIGPANTVLPAISGTTQVGSTLATTDGTWTGSPTGYTYQWKRGGTNIGSATASTYLLVTADLGAMITVAVTATNAGGSTSATATGVGPITSPYATWDPATVTSVTLSGSNLVATNTGTTSADQGAKVATASGKTSGKYYFETTWTTASAGNGNLGVGIGTTTSTYTGMGNNATTGNEAFQSGSTYSNGSIAGVGTGTVWSSGMVMGVAVDLDNRRIWFRQSPSGVWNGNGSNNPATNVGGLTIPSGTMVPFVTFGGSGGAASNVFTANFGASAFTGTVPSGFASGWLI